MGSGPQIHQPTPGDRVERALERARQQVERQVSAQIRAATRAHRVHDYRWNNRATSYATSYIDQTGSDADPCASNRDTDDDYRQHCEVRESTLPARPLTVDAGDSGGGQPGRQPLGR